MEAMIVEFPRSKSRRIAARRPRRSKNGTPEERAAKKAGNNAQVVALRRRRSKDDELVARVNSDADLAGSIAWPEVGEPADYPKNLEELADVDFAGIPEFVADGFGCGTPEFREKLEAYFRMLGVAGRHAFMVLGPSRRELIEKLDGDSAEAVESWLRILSGGYKDLVRLARYVRAAEVRLLVASTLCDMEAEATQH
jgi:hypothetical protein